MIRAKGYGQAWEVRQRPETADERRRREAAELERSASDSGRHEMHQTGRIPGRSIGKLVFAIALVLCVGNLAWDIAVGTKKSIDRTNSEIGHATCPAPKTK